VRHYLTRAYSFAPDMVKARLKKAGATFEGCDMLLEQWQYEAALLPTLPVDRDAAHFVSAQANDQHASVMIYDIDTKVWEEGYWVKLAFRGSPDGKSSISTFGRLERDKKVDKGLHTPTVMTLQEYRLMRTASKQFRRVWAAAADFSPGSPEKVAALESSLLKLS
jgi:hypothetical protein